MRNRSPEISVLRCLKWRSIKTYLGVNISELRKLSGRRIGKELRNRLHIGSNLPR